MIRDHADVVGSLVRPAWLLEARRQVEEGTIGADGLVVVGILRAEVGNNLSVEEQFEKLCLVTATAGEIWAAC